MPGVQIKFSSSKNFSNRPAGDALIVPCWEGPKGAEPALTIPKSLSSELHAISSKDFTGKQGEVSLDYHPGIQENRLILVGLGKEKEKSVESLRRSFGSLQKMCTHTRVEKINLMIPRITGLNIERSVQGIVEGLLLLNYFFDACKLYQPKERTFIRSLVFIGGDAKIVRLANQHANVIEGVYLARDLVNGNADSVTPQYLGKTAQTLAKKYPSISTTVWSKKRIEKEKMGLLLAVNRGSSKDPVFIISKYQGDPNSKDSIVLVGKGITYDTGGLSLKSSSGMETMKSDMGGAATCLGILQAVAKLKLKINLTVLIASTENSIGSKSYKVGDVYKGYMGKTVEIGNTDAEGRLVLADALAYAAQKLKPKQIINFATLTGAIVVALGDEVIGLMSNNDSLSKDLMDAGEKSYERACRLPLTEEYNKSLNSDIADLKNIGGPGAGSIKAGLFLQQFVGKIPWAHFDIAGTAFLKEEKPYLPKYATGVGVRLIIQYLKELS